MQLKRTIITLAAAGMLSTQAYASEAQVEAANQPAQAVAAFSEADMAALFEAADKPMQVAVLSDAEMKETEGALNPYLGRMLIGGGAAFTTSVYNQWDFNRGWRGYQTVNWGRALGAGAVGAGFGAASRWMANRGWF